MSARTTFRAMASALLLSAAGCAALFVSRGYPPTLAGLWFDATTATASDSSFWKLLPNGEEQTVRVVAVRAVDGSRRWERNVSPVNQWWHVEGSVADTAQRRLCIVIRPRGPGGCHRFALDTVTVGNRIQRRLVVFAFPMDRPHQVPMDHVLLERVPDP